MLGAFVICTLDMLSMLGRVLLHADSHVDQIDDHLYRM